MATGKQGHALAQRLTTDSALLAAGVSLSLCLLGLATIGPVFNLLGATSTLMPQINDYMGVWYWVEPLDVVLWTCLAAIRARGNATLESKIITAAALLNLLLDPLFIFGLLGFPRLEIQGAAVATLNSNAITLIFTLWYLHRRLRVFANIIAPVKTILDSWKHMLAIGIPAMVSNAIIPLSSAIVVVMIADYGVDAVAGYGLFIALLVSFLAAPLSGLFTHSDAIRSVAVEYLWIVAWSWGAYGLVRSVNAAFNGSGRPLPGVMISSLRVIFIFLPLAFTGRQLFGLNGLFAAGCVANISVGIMALIWLDKHINNDTNLLERQLRHYSE